MEQARTKAARIVRRTRAHMALEAQSEGLQSQKDAIEELASEMARAKWHVVSGGDRDTEPTHRRD